MLEYWNIGKTIHHSTIPVYKGEKVVVHAGFGGDVKIG
jgi:hypothetical protein